jgi:HAD superfamily hydrolase (TIGR01509 family)
LSEPAPDNRRTLPAAEPAPRQATGAGSTLAAVIFDMDGVLADTEPVHEMAMGEFLATLGKSISSDYYAHLVGLGHRAVWAKLRADLSIERSMQECLAGYQPILVSRSGHVPPGPGVVELVRALSAAGVPMAVASSSFRPVVEATLAGLGLRDRFGAVVTGDEVGHGKPAPDIYLKAAGALGVAPERCVAIEDSRHGVQSALAAGMACVGLVSRYTDPARLGASRVVESLADLGVADLARLLA